MFFPEEFYVHIQGQQKGPYTVVQLKRLYDSGFIPEESLYWREGFEQWQPVADLCGPSARVRKARRRVTQGFYAAAGIAVAAVILFFGPLIRDGWREMSQGRFTREAAYWKARGFVRERLLQTNVTVAFRELRAADVTLKEDDRTATAQLAATVYNADGSKNVVAWKVVLRHHSESRQWHFVSADPLR